MLRVENLEKRINHEVRPELHLWASVLEMAIHDFLFGDKSVKEEAYDWIFTKDKDSHMNTFINICYVLDLDPEAVRERLQVVNPDTFIRYQLTRIAPRHR